ncbi:MAG TPA: NAD(+)/NADH kinase [Cellvibrionaceae bacterium]
MRRLKVGLLVNPLAGMGGPLAQKGSDNLSLANNLSANFFALHALKRTQDFCNALGEAVHNIDWLVPSGLMGGDVFAHQNVSFKTTSFIPHKIPSAVDTRAVIAEFIGSNVDLIVFAGGDGTAADVARVVADLNPAQLALGIPAGVKIHSGVFAINPAAAGELVAALARGAVLNAESAQVRDLDELALKQGRVTSQYMGSLVVPFDGRFIQSVKQGGLVAEELIVADIAAYLIELVPDRATIVFGPGKTMADIQQQMGLAFTLLGFDVFIKNQCLALDADAAKLSALLLDASEPWVFLTVIGGQGHIIGRGNQQLTSKLLHNIGRRALHPIATKEKLATIGHGKLLIDSGDKTLDEQWQGLIPVICGYREQVLCDLVYLPA